MARRERDCKGDTWKNAISEGGGRIGVMDTFYGEADVEGRRRVADSVWMIRREEGHADHKGEIDR
jgi:hypothetical protein